MPLQNRVTPLGELIADPARGLVYGNRGCLHDEGGRIRRRFNGKRWIACRLQFRGWHRQRLMQPGRFTELFFLDEVTAFAAGHRPCALCRHEDYTRFAEIWRELHPGQVGAGAMDEQLHTERVDPATRGQLHHEAQLHELPDGAFIARDGEPWLVLGREILRWAPAGYVERRPRPARRRAAVITPPSLVEVLRAGWQPAVPLMHPSATAAAYDGRVPRLVPAVVPPGRMREIGQPLLHASSEVALRAWSEGDVSAVMGAFADPDIRYWHMRELTDEVEAHTWIAGWRDRWSSETDGSWAIVAAATDDVVGQVALRTVSLEFGDGQITYWVLPGSRREGMATLAATEVSRWAFDELGLHRLEIKHSTANPWSCRVAEKVGFALEGTMRSALLHEDGWHDMHVHARSAP